MEEDFFKELNHKPSVGLVRSETGPSLKLNCKSMLSSAVNYD